MTLREIGGRRTPPGTQSTGLTVGGPQPPGLRRRRLVRKSPFMISLQGVSRDAWSEQKPDCNVERE